MEIFIFSFLIFALSVLALVVGQWLRGAQLPAGCTPVGGVCCRTAGENGVCQSAGGCEPVAGIVPGKGS